VGVAAGRQYQLHYFHQLLPALVLLGAPVLTAIWTHTRTYCCFLLHPCTLQVVLASTAAGFLIANAITLGLQRPANALSTYVRDHSTPADTVFFWGQVDYLYAEAQRRPASRYINAAPLTGYIWGSPTRFDPDYDTSSRMLPGAWDLLQADFQHSPPLFFVDTDPETRAKKYPPLRYPFLKHLLEQDYEVVLATPDGVIYRRLDHH
jgi:hypothetical protein